MILDGADGTRTRGLLAASQSLSQLSYGPSMVSQSSREVEVVGPIDAASLVVSSGRQPEVELRSAFELLDRKKEAAIELGAVSSERVNLRGRVKAPTQSFASSSGRVAAHDDDVVVPRGPLALNANQSIRPKDHVVASALRKGAIDLDPELERGGCDAGLRDRSFLIRCHFRQRSRRIGWAVS